MKIGILTFHRAYNYGAVLQCYALQEVLKGMGHDVEVIDYRQNEIERRYDKHFRIIRFLKSILLLKPNRYIMCYIDNKKKSKKFESFRHKFLNVSEIVDGNKIPPKYDRYIIGSDQLWNDGITHGFDKVYWGLFDKPSQSKTYGYAISGNGKFKGYIAKESIINGVNAFDGITFREKTLRDVIKNISGKEYPLAIDPTLLTDESTWDPLINIEWSKRNYVLVYEVRFFKEDKDMIVKKAMKYASERNAEVISLMDDNLSVSDFVSAIKYADCIFTSSFHAVAFSVIFRKSFYAFQLYDGNDYRYVDLLESLNLHDHLVDCNTIIEKQNPISNEDVSNRMALLQKPSLAYLKDATAI